MKIVIVLVKSALLIAGVWIIALAAQGGNADRTALRLVLGALVLTAYVIATNRREPGAVAPVDPSKAFLSRKPSGRQNLSYDEIARDPKNRREVKQP